MQDVRTNIINAAKCMFNTNNWTYIEENIAVVDSNTIDIFNFNISKATLPVTTILPKKNYKDGFVITCPYDNEISKHYTTSSMINKALNIIFDHIIYVYEDKQHAEGLAEFFSWQSIRIW